jgi:uncharacterized RmlC-like cupin family protein
MLDQELRIMSEASVGTESSVPTCKLIRPNEVYEGKQELHYVSGLSAESVGANAICMHLLTIPSGKRGRAHKHENHETAIYILRGEASMYYGEKLEQTMTARAGEMVYIPAGVPHLPFNASGQPCQALIARTDPNEQESVVLLPELELRIPGD